ncbi:uncharacterized protein [Cherax quadricarinatus]|uniref:uncharacterized protein isoform X3 n=1 Tax=Cherax quadricarinatus TaxID=27406 RepID=UPI00387E7A74
MHLPLLLTCDTLLKKIKPWPNLHWIGENSSKAYLVSERLIGEVDLHTGSVSRIHKLSSMTKAAAAINYTYNGSYIYGILTTGDLFFWDQKSGSLFQAQGIPPLVMHTPCSADKDSDGPLQVVLDFFKLPRPQNLSSDETTDNAQSAPTCSIPPHQKPYIFASSDCSKVVVVLGASQVYLWERDSAYPFSKKNSSLICGHWTVAECGSDIPLPNLQSRESQITSCFLAEGSREEKCHTTFSFIDDTVLIITTLTLKWEGLGCMVPQDRVVSAYWSYISVSHLALGLKSSQVLQEKGTLISQYAHGQSLICIALNSLQQHSKLTYLHPMCNTAVVTCICDAAAASQHDLPNSNGDNSHWVSSMCWSQDNTYVIGCLRSGAVFVATRMGPLLKISCSGDSLQFRPAVILPLHPYLHALQKDSSCEEVTVCMESGSASTPEFCVSCHPVKDQFLLSSGLRVSVLVFPENGRRDGDIVDQLLSTAHHSLYLLRHSSLTHDYAYIRCSTWRLALSVQDLSRNVNESLDPDRPKIKVWDTDSPSHEECKTRLDVASEGEQLIEQAMKPLLAAWAVITSHTGPQTHDWRRRAKHVAQQLVKLVNTIMQTTLHDDYSHHQAQLLQMLHIFHHFVRVLAVWPTSLHMVRPTLWLTHQILHIFLSCERHAGESSMINTLLILTQTLTSVENTLTQVYTFKPIVKFPSHLEYSNVDTAAGVEVTNITAISWTAAAGNPLASDSAICTRMKNLWICLHINSMKVYSQLGKKKMEKMCYLKLVSVMNIIQSRLQNFGHSFCQKKVKLQIFNQLLLNGMHLGAVNNLKSEIIKNLSNKCSRKTLCRYFHSILYTYLLRRDFVGVSDFLHWLCKLLNSYLCTKKLSGLSNSNMSSTLKPKKCEAKVSLPELDLSPVNEERTQTTSQNTVKAAVAHQLSKEASQECQTSSSIRKYSEISAKTSEKDGEFQPSCNLIYAARQVIGSLGRIMTGVILQHDIHIPSPHHPDIIPSVWLDYPKLKDSGGDAATSCSIMKDDIHKAYISTETAGKALAIAGYWSDLTALSFELADTRTALFASLISITIEKNGIPASSSLHPSNLIIKYMLNYGPMEQLKSSVFHSYQELLQVASMACLEVIPTILEECLQKVQKVMENLELFVPSYVYLPAPPVFCPQVSSDSINTLKSSGVTVRFDERTLRKELAGWIRLFCSIISAAGIAQPLLHNYQHGSIKIKPNQEAYTIDILSWVQVLYKVVEFDSWRDELISTALTAASNSPPLPVIAQALAQIIQNPSQLPSLFKEKANRLYDIWKTTNVVVTESNFIQGNTTSERQESVTETFTHLYSIYDKECVKAMEKCDVSNRTERDALEDNTLHFSDNVIDMSSTQTTPETIIEEYRKFMFLFASMTFARDAEMFPEHITQVPRLAQFSDTVKKKVFLGMRMKSQIFENKNEDCTEHLEQNILDNENCSDTLSTSTNEKRGFFQNLDYSNIWQGDVNTVSYLHSKMCMNNLRSIQRKGNSSFLQKKHSESQIISSHHVTRDVSDQSFKQSCSIQNNTSKARNSGGRKGRSHSLDRRQRTTTTFSQARRSRSSSLTKYQKQKNFVHLNVIPTFSSQQACTSHNSLLNDVLHLPNSQNLGAEYTHLQELIKLVCWLMSSERRFCLSVLTVGASKSSITKKMDLNFDDIVLALGWESLYLCNLCKTLRKNLKTCRHEKKQDTDSKDAEILKRNKKSKHIKKKQTVQQAMYSPSDISGAEKENAGQSVTSQNGARVKHSSSGVDKRPRRKDIFSIAFGLEKQKIERESQNGLNVLSAVGLKRAEHVLEEKGQSPNDLNATDNNIENDNSSCLYSISCISKVDLKNPDTSQGNVMDNSLSSHNNSCIKEVVPADTIEDELDGKAFSSINIQKTCDLNQSLSTNGKTESLSVEESCKALESKAKTPVNKECSHSTQHSASTGGENIVMGALEKRHPDCALITTTNNVPPKYQESNTSEDLKEIKISTEVFHSQSKEKSENQSKKGIVERNIKNKVRHKVRGIHEETDPEAVGEITTSEGIWRPFTAKEKCLHKPLKVIEVEEARKQVLQRSLPSRPQKKISLTPIETPSIEANNGTFPKLLHLPYATCEDNRLSIMDPSCNATSLSNPSSVLPVEDTLDDVTLPDSLHASDLENECDSMTSENIIQENIIHIHKFQFPKREISDKTKGKLSAKQKAKVVAKSPKTERWDERVLQLNPVPIEVKPITTDLDHYSGKQHCKGQCDAHTFSKMDKQRNRQLKLLTLPKHSINNIEATKDCSPLLLKQLPAEKILQINSKNNNVSFTLPGKGGLDYSTNMQNYGQHKNLTIPLQPNVISSKYMKLLTLPASSYSQPSEKINANFPKFVDPKQVFSYMANVITNKENKFKALKLTEPIISQNFSDVQRQEICTEDPSENKEEKFNKSSAQDEGLDTGFLDIVKEYAEKYKTNTSKTIMAKKVDTTDGNVEAKNQYRTTQRIDKASQSKCLHYQSNRETQTLPQIFNDFQFYDANKDDKNIPCVDKEVIAQDNAIFERKKSETEEKFELTSSPMNCGSPKEQFKDEYVEAIISVKDSWTEMSTVVLDHNIPRNGCEVQTQTHVETTDASVSTPVTVSFHPQPQDDLFHLPTQESLQVHQVPSKDHLSSNCTLLPTSRVTLDINPLTTALDSSYDSYKETGTLQGIVHVVDIPHAIAQRRLKEIGDELNKTIHCCELDVIPSPAGAREVSEVLSNSLENSKDKKVRDKVATDRLQTLHDLLLNESALEKDKYDEFFQHYETQKMQTIVSVDNKENILLTEGQIEHERHEIPEHELPVITTDSSPKQQYQGNNKITMNELAEAFSDGRITLENLYKMSYSMPIENEEKVLVERDANQDVEDLEQQALKAAVGLNESRTLLSKVNLLLQTSEKLEKERLESQRLEALDKNITHSSSIIKKNQAYDITQNIPFDNLGWQEMLSSYKKTGNPDMILRFVETVNLEDITDEMIDEIMKWEAMHTNKDSPHCTLYFQDSPNSLLETHDIKTVLTDNESPEFSIRQSLSEIDCLDSLRQINKGISRMSQVQTVNEGAVTERSPREGGCKIVDNLNETETVTDSPKLHLDLTELRSWSSSSLTTISKHGSANHSTFACDTKVKRQQRRAEIRAWMKKQMEKRLEPVQAISQNTIAKTHLKTSKYQGKTLKKSTGTIKMENQGLCGKQLRERSREREDQRVQLREDHQRKREQDVAKLFVDHEEELATHRDLMVKKLLYESPRISRRTERKKNTLSNTDDESQSSLRLKRTCASIRTTVHSQQSSKSRLKSSSRLAESFVTKPKSSAMYRNYTLPEEKALFKTNAGLWRKGEQSSSVVDNLSSSSASLVSFKGPTDRNRTRVLKEQNIDNVNSVQTELTNLIMCLKPREIDKTLPFKESVNKPLLSSTVSLQMKSGGTKGSLKSMTEWKKPVNPEKASNDKFKFKSSLASSTYPLSLDRISEVDSNTPAASSLDVSNSRQEESLSVQRDEGCSKHEDSSSESSWTIPTDVKNLLYG